jgi:hypothetical protein
MLKIVKATEPMPVANIVVTVYSQPGLGKSSLGFTADKPLLLDFDKGSYRAANRGDAVPIVSWSDVVGMTAEDLAPYNTIVVDTAGRALDVLAQDIIDSNPKMGNSGNLSLQGFGVLKSRFAQWKTFLTSQRKDIVLLAHMTEEKKGDDFVERIDAQGASKNEVYKSSDAMCRIIVGARGERSLLFSPRENGFGKDPAQLGQIAFPTPLASPHFLGETIKQIKESINKQTAEQAEAVKEAEKWQKAIAEANGLAGINQLLGLAKEKKDKMIIGLVAKAAKERGFKPNKSTGLYEEVAA